jgi:signal transduction histidine kinase
VRGIVDLHGGNLEIASSVSGTRVEVRLPARHVASGALAGGPSAEGTRGRSERL